MNIVSWNNRKPEADIRKWAKNHGQMGEMIASNGEDVEKLKEWLQDLDVEKLGIE